MKGKIIERIVLLAILLLEGIVGIINLCQKSHKKE